MARRRGVNSPPFIKNKNNHKHLGRARKNFTIVRHYIKLRQYIVLCGRNNFPVPSTTIVIRKNEYQPRRNDTLGSFYLLTSVGRDFNLRMGWEGKGRRTLVRWNRTGGHGRRRSLTLLGERGGIMVDTIPSGNTCTALVIHSNDEKC
jgi:hypothetical protein